MRFIFVGHTVGVKLCIESIKSTSSHEVAAVFTHKKELHQYDLSLFELHKELWGKYAYNVFNVTKDYNIPVIEYDDINSSASIELFKKYQADCIVTIGCRDIFKTELIQSISYCINLHPFDIPHWRGGGIDSWMILNGAWGSTQYATSHFISEKLDSGNIICKKSYTIDKDSYPLDIFKKRIGILGDLLMESIPKLESGFKGETQEHSSKLFTPRDGKINLNWKGEEILKFIYAFGYPYPGAFLDYEGAKISILEAEFVKKAHIHPFSTGLVFRSSKKSFHFFVEEGEIFVKKWSAENIDLKIKLGKFLK